MKKKFIDKKPFLIAEISGNHGGNILNAKKLIKKAKLGGFNAVKLQTYTPDMMTIKNLNFKIKKGLWKSNNLWSLYKKAHTPLNWHKSLFKYAKKINIKIFFTPFSTEAVDFLEKLKCKVYKISSFEMNDVNLIKKVAQTGKPLIISTGLSNINEIQYTLKIARKYGAKDITLLYCVSKYPSKSLDFNLDKINLYKKKFKCPVGLSDHSIGSLVPLIAISKGAELIEKHVCLDSIKTVDSKFSLKSSDIKNFVKKLHECYKICFNKNSKKNSTETENKIFRRSIYALQNIKKGEIFTTKNIKTFRPELGLSAKYYLNLLGRKSKKDIKKFRPLNKKLNQNL